MSNGSLSRLKGALASLLLISALGACAFVDESVTLKHTSQVAVSSVGQGLKVGLKVVDERTTTSIGFRGPMRTAEISAAQDVRQLLNDAVMEGLRNQGFDPVAYTGAEPILLDVQLRELSYEATPGFFTGGVHTRAALKAIARRSQDSFEELYRAEGEERVLIVPTAASDAERINLVLSQAIDKMLADQHLLKFLAESQ